MSLNFGGEPSGRSSAIDYPALVRKLRREFVDQSGDTMTGQLTIPRATENQHAITKRQVETYLVQQKDRLEKKIEDEKDKLGKKIEDEKVALQSSIASITSNIIVTVDNNRRALLTRIQDEITRVNQSISTLTTTINTISTTLTSNINRVERSVVSSDAINTQIEQHLDPIFENQDDKIVFKKAVDFRNVNVRMNLNTYEFKVIGFRTAVSTGNLFQNVKVDINVINVGVVAGATASRDTILREAHKVIVNVTINLTGTQPNRAITHYISNKSLNVNARGVINFTFDVMMNLILLDVENFLL